MTKKDFKIGIYTLGCKVSQYESAAIKEELGRRGFSVNNQLKGNDVNIINTCTVTGEADRKCGNIIRRAAGSGAKVMVIGCYSQISPKALEAIPGVVYVAGTANKLNCIEEVEKLYNNETLSSPEYCAPDVNGFEDMHISEFDRTRAYIKIQDGCESKCSYCIIPQARGTVRSKKKNDILKEILGLVENGCNEVVLTGIEVDAWGRDLGNERLIDLLEYVDRIPGDFRIRLGSLDPYYISEDFAKRISELSKFAPHLHLSVQSGSSDVLAAMRRRYNADKVINAVDLLRRYIPRICFTCDVIVGFPGETEEDFNDTCKLSEYVRFINMHIFPYSERPGTDAASLPDKVPQSVKKKRAAKLAALRDVIKHKEISDICANAPIKRVLIENTCDGGYTAHSEEFLEFMINAEKLAKGEFIDVKVLEVKNGVCYAIPLNMT